MAGSRRATFARARWTAHEEEVRACSRALRARGERVAFVPTMGYLHAGHLSLVERARQGGARVIASVFVNPLQFGPREDFRAYPRDRARDQRLLAEAGVELVYAPHASVFYPSRHVTRITVGGVAEPLEGALRPGHFAGVATVVGKMLHVVDPDELWLGQKDAQQVAVLTRMVRDLAWPVRLCVGATVREPDGLAMSSRNVRLTPAERVQAALLYAALQAGRAALRACGGARGGARGRARPAARAAVVAERAMRAVLARATLARVDYARLVDPATFEAPSPSATRGLLVVAARFPSARLIDNLSARWARGAA